MLEVNLNASPDSHVMGKPCNKPMSKIERGVTVAEASVSVVENHADCMGVNAPESNPFAVYQSANRLAKRKAKEKQI